MKTHSEGVTQGVRIQLLHMGSAYLLSRALHVAAELGISDLLVDGPKHSAELARATGCDEDSLYRLLRMLASNGVFAEDGHGRFGLTTLASALRTDIPGSLRDAIRMVDDEWWNVYGHLEHSLRKGEPAYEAVTGRTAYGEDSEESERFAKGIANFGKHENYLIAKVYDFSKFKRCVDVGGGRGDLIAHLLDINGEMQGVLFDRPDVVAHPAYVIEAGLEDRCEFVGGDFFTSVPGGADVYVMKRIIHNWSDDRALRILRNCKQAMAEGGRILTIDAVIPPGNERHPAKDSDLLMMAMLGGRERTEDEFRSLYDRAGLQLTAVISTHSILSILEGAAN
jgi:hypothetical protein